MSLIHEALKKIEGIKDGSTRPPDYACAIGAGGGSQVSKKSVLAAAAALIGVAAGLYFYLHYYSRPLVKAPPLKPSIAASALQKAQPQSQPRPQAASQTQADTQNGNKKGIALYRAGQTKESIDEFRSAIGSLGAGAAAEDKSVLYNNLGVSYLAADDLAKAEAALKKSIFLRPSYAEAVNNYGAMLEKKGDRAGALKELRKAAALDPAYPDAHLNIAIVLEAAGKYREAAGEYGVFITLASSIPYSQRSDYADKAEGVRNKLRKLNSNMLIAR